MRAKLYEGFVYDPDNQGVTVLYMTMNAMSALEAAMRLYVEAGVQDPPLGFDAFSVHLLSDDDDE